MNDLTVGVSFVEAKDGRVDVWFHLPDSEGDVREMSESFIAGTFQNIHVAKHAVVNTGAMLVKYQNNGEIIR